MEFGLKDKTIEDIRSIFTRFPEVETVIIYGSRAKGNYKNGSDIDLTFKGKDLSLKTINAIDHEIDDLLLPYTFDLSIYEHIDNPDLHDHIERAGKVFYKRSG